VTVEGANPPSSLSLIYSTLRVFSLSWELLQLNSTPAPPPSGEEKEGLPVVCIIGVVLAVYH
jgi:hypothetical protein